MMTTENITRCTKNFIENIKFKCLFSDRGCSANLSISNYHEHHNKRCKFADKLCICKEEIKFFEKYKNHMLKCKFSTKKCVTCKKKFSIKDILLHEKNCFLIKKCEICGNHFPEKNFTEHSQSCRDYEVECCNCRLIFPKSLLNLHTEKRCFEESSKYNIQGLYKN